MMQGWAFDNDEDESTEDLSSDIQPNGEHFCIELEVPSSTITHDASTSDRQRAMASLSDFSGIAMRDSGPLKMAVLTDSKWQTGRTITIAFFNGAAELQQKVQQYARQWTQHANLIFSFISSTLNADVRIAFNTPGKGHQSYVGTACLTKPKSEPTMHLDLYLHTPEKTFRRVVLHEFGHVLGAIHEHQRPDMPNIKWNKKAVMEALGWTEAEVEHNILKKETGNLTASAFDSKSIMLYMIPPSWTYYTFQSQHNTVLSATDIEFVNKLYPFDSTPAPPPPVIPTPPVISTAKVPMHPNSDIAAIYIIGRLLPSQRWLDL
ncbi:hypothetical protein C8J56DRAFT_387371 [Mycena floridula]|nr:hypothetical protein C8J56DRAFT_387371 [Mycena floridula]